MDQQTTLALWQYLVFELVIHMVKDTHLQYMY